MVAIGDLLAGNRREGPHSWDVGALDQRRLGRDAVPITVRWLCRRPDGSTIWDFLDSYLLATEEDRWRILGDVVHEAHPSDMEKATPAETR